MTLRDQIDWRCPARQAWQKSEHELQRELVARVMALASKHPDILDLHAIPNGDWRGPRVASRLKTEGVLPGVPDLFLPTPRGKWHGFYIELKQGRGSVSDVQWGFMERAMSRGYLCRVYNNLQLALEAVEEYLEGKI
jgi:hypothetical protein